VTSALILGTVLSFSGLALADSGKTATGSHAVPAQAPSGGAKGDKKAKKEPKAKGDSKKHSKDKEAK
jgi:hypothetical protein